MATRAYVLIEIGVGKTKAVLQGLQTIKEIKSVDVVTGPYDFIAVIEAPDMNSIGDLITKQIHEIPGITRTITCIAVKMT